MKNFLSIAALLFALLFGSQAEAAGTRPGNMTASSAIVGTQIVWCPTGTTADFQCTFTQVAAFINSLVSGDCTATGTGGFTCTKTNGTAFGALATVVPGSGIATFLTTPSSANLLAALTGSTGTGANVFGTAPTISSLNATTAMTLAFLTGSTQCLQVNTSGTISGTGTACGGSGSTGANPTATAGPTAVNGSATTFMRSDGAPAVQLGTGSAPGLVQCGLGLTCTGGVAGSQVTQRNNTATTDTLLSTDSGTVITENNASPVAVGIAVASTTGFTTGNYWTVKNKGAGLVTTTPTTSTIDGAATLTLAQNSSVDIYSDGTNYWTLPGRSTSGGSSTITAGTTATSGITSGDFISSSSNLAQDSGKAVPAGAVVGTTDTQTLTNKSISGSQINSGTVPAAQGGAGTVTGALKGNGSGVVSQAGCADLSNGTALCSTVPGTGVATAAAANLSAAGGLTTTIASGTAALGTSAIASGACATVVTVTATNVATTDVASFGYNADPTAITGYGASATGAVLTVYPYPTSGNVNVKVCNSTASSITPGAMTVNWRVTR